MQRGCVGHAMSHPVVAYQVAVGRYVQEAGRPVEVDEEVVVLLDLAGQAGEPMAGWLLPCCQFRPAQLWSCCGGGTDMRATIPARMSDEYCILCSLCDALVLNRCQCVR